MKISELNIEDSDDNCYLCAAHLKAEDVISDDSALKCPHCGYEAMLEIVSYRSSIEVVGETNRPEDNEEINKRYVWECQKCSQYSEVALRPIIYNGNHDVYYTGGSEYLPVDGERERLEASIKSAIHDEIVQYTDRIKSGGHGLEPWNLETWIGYSLTGVVAETLMRLTRQREINK